MQETQERWRRIKFARKEKQLAVLQSEGLLHVREPEKIDTATGS